jgi:hypothetical protein
MDAITPILPFSLWVYRGRNVVVTSSRICGDLWEIEYVDSEKIIKLIKITCDEWVKNSIFIDQVDDI